MARQDQAFLQWVEQMGSRFPDGFVDNRLKKEFLKADSIFQSESRLIGKWANARTLMTYALRITRLSDKGANNALDIKLRHNRLPILQQQDAFEAYRILHISDPHFNDHDGFIDNLIDVIQQTQFDLCVLTGDYRFRSFGTSEMALRGVGEIARVVDTDILAILGNHDSLEMVPEFERLGISVLINEHIVYERGGAQLVIAGVDDPRYYRSDDIHRSLLGVPEQGELRSILLAHSPELYQDAADAGFDAYLCGHTHGGQVCLVPGKTLLKNFRSPNWTLAGNWNHEGMLGYTSMGVGTSVVNARFNCEPEITLHELCCH